MIPLAQPVIGSEEIAAVTRVLRSGSLAQGREVAEFEFEFARLVEGRHCIAVNSGTSALHLGLLSAGIGEGDEVIIPSFSFAATANAVRLTGATPVFVDIDPDSFCVAVDAVDAAITQRTVAIMPVHLYGHPADAARLSGIAAQNGLLLVEDAAQAHGAAFRGRPVGALGHLAAFSFYPTKNMTTGEGGMIVTPDAQIARRARLLRNQGMEQRYRNEVVGFNCRMTEMSAAIGRVQLGRLHEWTERRRSNARALDAGLAKLPGVRTPPVSADVEHAFHQYTIRVSRDRDEAFQRITSDGVGAAVYYPVPIHQLPSFDIKVQLDETQTAAGQVLSLPVHPSVTATDLDTIVGVVRSAVRQ